MGIRAKVVDRRVARTQRLLRDALLSLVLERGWDATSVQDICERADVGRSTFYVHFADKEDLLLSGFEAFQAELEQQLQPSDEKPLTFIRPLVEHVRQHHALFRALLGKRSAELVQQRFVDVLSGLLEREFAKVMGRGVRRSATVRYAAGATLELLTWWLDTRSRLDVNEVAELLQELTAGLLSQAKRMR